MPTRVVQVDSKNPDPALIREAAAILRAGGLIAFPTETVYGLAANALEPDAVARIFTAKGRPATNPVIVHVAEAADVAPLVSAFPETARRLAARFWPGPLTLVLPRSDRVPDIVTAAGSTVALRVPDHAVALGLLQACGLPLAAPSANPSTLLSATTAAHVLRGLDGKIDMILDAGPTPGGLESTVLDVTVTPPRLLRPGLVSQMQLETILGPLAHGPIPGDIGQPARSPGQQERHYAPRTPLECVPDAKLRIAEHLSQSRRVGWLTHHDVSPSPGVVVARLPTDPAGYAAGLYAALHRLDDAGLDVIVVDEPPADDAWVAVRDRLVRAGQK